jgi:hypothetical protein
LTESVESIDDPAEGAAGRPAVARWRIWGPIVVSLALWVASLLLPAFVTEERPKPLTGIEVFAEGLLFGWMSRGIAVYANLFYFYSAVRLTVGRKPFIALIMMAALALTLPNFAGVPRDEGTMTILPVVSWGWGAGVWLLSLVVLAFALPFRSSFLSDRVVAGGAVALLLAALAVGDAFLVLQTHQRAQANAQEIALYLPDGMAFTNAPLCGLPLVRADPSPPPHDRTVALDAASGLLYTAEQKFSLPHLNLPGFANERETDRSLATYPEDATFVFPLGDTVPSNAPPRVLQYRWTRDGAVVRLFETATGRVLYEQSFHVIPVWRERRGFCPFRSRSLSPGHDLSGYDTALANVLGDQPLVQQSLALSSPDAMLVPKDERLTERCDLGPPIRTNGAVAANADGGLPRLWDGRTVILEGRLERARQGLCSKKYAALVLIEPLKAIEDSDLFVTISVFDRRTLQHVALLHGSSPCTVSFCQRGSRESASTLQIDAASAELETESGPVKFQAQGASWNRWGSVAPEGIDLPFSSIGRGGSVMSWGNEFSSLDLGFRPG